MDESSKNRISVGLIILGAAIVISALILANSLKKEAFLNGELSGSLQGSFVLQEDKPDEEINSSNDIDTKVILSIDEVSIMLGYVNKGDLIKDITSNKLEKFPYLLIGGRFVFNKKSVEEWVYEKSLSRLEIK